MQSHKSKKSRSGRPAHGFDFKHNGTELSAWGGPAFIFAAILAAAFALILTAFAVVRGGWAFL